MDFPAFIIAMSMFSLPVIAIVGHYIVKLRKMQIDSDQTIVGELDKMNRQIAELSQKIDRIEAPKKTESLFQGEKRPNPKQLPEEHTGRPLLQNQLDREADDEHTLARRREPRFE